MILQQCGKTTVMNKDLIARKVLMNKPLKKRKSLHVQLVVHWIHHSVAHLPQNQDQLYLNVVKFTFINTKKQIYVLITGSFQKTRLYIDVEKNL